MVRTTDAAKKWFLVPSPSQITSPTPRTPMLASGPTEPTNSPAGLMAAALASLHCGAGTTCIGVGVPSATPAHPAIFVNTVRH
jgi:hypothetical protein